MTGSSAIVGALPATTANQTSSTSRNSSSSIFSNCDVPAALPPSGGPVKSIELAVDLEAQLVPWLRPFSPAFFILKRRRLPMSESKDGFEMRPRIVLANSSPVSELEMISAMLLARTLSIFQPVVQKWNMKTYARKYNAWSRIKTFISFEPARPVVSFHIILDL